MRSLHVIFIALWIIQEFGFFPYLDQALSTCIFKRWPCIISVLQGKLCAEAEGVEYDEGAFEDEDED